MNTSERSRVGALYSGGGGTRRPGIGRWGWHLVEGHPLPGDMQN